MILSGYNSVYSRFYSQNHFGRNERNSRQLSIDFESAKNICSFPVVVMFILSLSRFLTTFNKKYDILPLFPTKFLFLDRNRNTSTCYFPCLESKHGALCHFSFRGAPDWGRGSTPLYGLCRYVRPQRVGFGHK